MTFESRSYLAALPLAAWLGCTSVEEQAAHPRPGSAVEVYLTGQGPTQPYGELGEINVDEKLDDQAALEALREEAGRESCDAIIVRPDGRSATCLFYTPE